MKTEVLNILADMKSPSYSTREGAYTKAIYYFENTNLKYNELEGISNTILSDDYLFNQISQGVSDMTPGRSYMLLLLVLVVNQRDTSFSISGYYHLIQKYFELENDLRTKAEDLGWIHTIAHMADLICFTAYYKDFSKEQLESLIRIMFSKIVTLEKIDSTEEIRIAIALEQFYKDRNYKESSLYKDYINNKIIKSIFIELDKQKSLP